MINYTIKPAVYPSTPSLKIDGNSSSLA